MNELIIYFLVRDDLKMSNGKTATQCCHAIEELLQTCDQRLKKPYLQGCRKKVCLKVKDKLEFEWISESCRDKGVPYYIVKDAGLTEVKSGEETVMGIGPIQKSLSSALLGHLKLL